MTEKGEVVIGWTTVATSTEAAELGSRLIEERLAACVQVDTELRSFFRWKGNVCEEAELRLWIKTTRERAGAIERFFAANHPYETPQWVWVAADGAATPYSRWVAESVRFDGHEE